MAPSIPIDYTWRGASKTFSRIGFGDIMGKTCKVTKGYSTGFVSDYSHAVEAVGESEDFTMSGHVEMEFSASQESCGPHRKPSGLNVDCFDESVVPIQLISLSRMPPFERKGLKVRLKTELEQVRKLQRTITSFNLDSTVHSHTTDIPHYQNFPNRQATMQVLPRSTGDMAMATGKKKSAPGRNVPRTKGGDVPNKRNESVKQSLPQSSDFVLVMKQCETLLSRLMGHQHAWIFNEPVDIVKHNIPDYFNVIKQPMDFGTVKKKLLSNQYSSPFEFATDVRLTLKNAMTYNPPGHDVHYMAEVLSKHFEVRWKPIEKKNAPMADESTVSKSALAAEPESVYVPPPKKQKVTTMGNKVKHEREKRVMSDNEKQKLGSELEESLAELPDNIINFMKESTQNGGLATEDEIEIDIDSLSDNTLFTLRKLLDDFLREKQKKQAVLRPSEIEMQKESGSSNVAVQPCKDDELTDEDVDICGNDPPPMSCSSIKIDKDAAQRNSNCSRSSSSGSGSSSNDSENSSASETEDANNSANASTLNATLDTRADQKECGLVNPNSGDCSNGPDGQNLATNSDELNCQPEGESSQPERQASPEKLYRAALLRSRFADIIIKAQENSANKAEKPDPEKLRFEREELERRRREEKARLQAEAKAAEEARKKADAEAAAEAMRKRELEREAARQALQKMEKTVDIDGNNQFMEDLEMFRSGPNEHLHGLLEDTSPESCQNGLGGFKFQSSGNPLEQLGLYMKNDEDEDEEEPDNNWRNSDDPEGD